MDLRGLVSSGVTWLLVFEICVLTPMVSCQIQGCSMEGIDLLQCLNQENSSFTDNCCKTLRQVVQAGYNCLCSLLSVSPSIPLFSSPFSLPLSNCDISVPPLTLCRVLAPMPVVFPPTAASPKELAPPSPPPQNVLVPPPPLLSLPPPLPSLPPLVTPVPTNSTRKDNSTMVATQPLSNATAVPELCVNNSENDHSSNGKEESKLLSSLLLLALQAFVLLA